MKILTFAEISKLSPSATIKQIVEQTRAESRAFITAAKLMLHLETKLKADETLGSKLRKSGVRKSTIDNGRYAMRVFTELVEPGHLTEDEFDGFTFGDCLRICRVIGSRSAKRLEGPDVAVVIRNSKTWDEELNSIYEFGMTVEEKAAVEAEAVKAAEAAAAAAAAAEDDDSSDDNPDAAPTPAAATPPSEPTAPGDEDPDEVADGKITPMPTAANPTAPATAESAIGLIDRLEAIILELPIDEQRKVAARLIALGNDIAEIVADQQAA